MSQIEAMLQDEPDDPFLRYGLAMEHAGIKDDAACARLLRDLIDRPAGPPYIPAYLQAGQAYARLDQIPEACQVLREGIVAAREVGDDHARGEMEGLLASLE